MSTLQAKFCSSFSIRSWLLQQAEGHASSSTKRKTCLQSLTVVDQELDRLQRDGVLQPVNYSAWATPIVAVKKPQVRNTPNKMENTATTPAIAGDSKRTKPKIDSSTVLLRVKRPFSEPPVECFNAIPCKKRCQGYPQVKKGKCFRYVGSTTEDVGGLDALQDMGAVGARRIFWTSTSTAWVINPEDEKKIDYQVHLSGAKRRLSTSPPSSPRRRSRSPPLEVVANLPTEGGPPSKCLRVIDLESCSSIPPASDPLAITMNGLRLVATPVEPPKVEPVVSKTAEHNFVYDVYRIDPGAARMRYPSSAEGSPDLEGSSHRRVYLEDAEYRDDVDVFDDDSDSNSESNWRNDYPDDDDEFAYLDKDDDDEEDTEDGKDSDDDDDDTSDEEKELSRHRPYQSRRVVFSSDPFASLLL